MRTWLSMTGFAMTAVALGLSTPVQAAETKTVPVVAAPASASAPTPVRVVSANPLTGPVTCQNAVWPNVPPECLKGKDGDKPAVRQVRVVGAQDDLRTNPAAASEAGKAPKKLKRLPRQN